MHNKGIIEIRAGAGGDEAANFAGDLVRMYQKYALKRGWRFMTLDSNQTSLSGYKTFIGKIEGMGCYEELQNESGVHRVQRVPSTEKSGRIHTSTASVAIMPEVEPKEVNIGPSDIEISFFRSSGPGGQNQLPPDRQKVAQYRVYFGRQLGTYSEGVRQKLENRT